MEKRKKSHLNVRLAHIWVHSALKRIMFVTKPEALAVTDFVNRLHFMKYPLLSCKLSQFLFDKTNKVIILKL